jgi:diguanylate cyclase (GGDEF)-like protein
MLLDLDGFKPVNDKFGHAAGDAVLVEASRRINQAIRGGDFEARLGGDEFALLLTQPATEHAANEVAARILDALARPLHVGNHQVTIGGSIGLTIGEGNLDNSCDRRTPPFTPPKQRAKAWSGSTARTSTYPRASQPLSVDPVRST